MDYQEQANNFATKNQVKFEILGSEYKKHFASDTTKRYVFKCKLSHKRKSYTFEFGQSITEGSNEPSLYDVLACLQKYEVGTFDNFCSDFGYENRDEYTGKFNKDTFRIYKAVCKEFEGVQRVFEHCLDELQEIQ